MTIFDWIIAAFVILSVIYLSFVLTLADWLSALRKGQAVTLLPERKGQKQPLWVQVGIILLGLVICIPFFYYLWIPLAVLPATTARVLQILGLILYIMGIAFVLWARRTLGKNLGLSTSLQVKLLDDHQLIQDGPYAFVRHPMYSGWWAAMLGLTLLYPVWAVFLMFLFSVISFFGRARREEAALAERFGTAWTEYKKRTKFIIPFLY
jgi:protein-S-isoprenylcysteine O-methyltransferase Ste14